MLAAHHSGGVIKKAKSGRKVVLSSRARRRQEKSADRAEVVMERTALKVQRSKGHARVIHSRKKTWDEVNKEVFERDAKPQLSKKAKAKMEEDAMVADFYADKDGDAEMDGAGDGAEEPAAENADPRQQVVVPMPTAADDEEVL